MRAAGDRGLRNFNSPVAAMAGRREPQYDGRPWIVESQLLDRATAIRVRLTQLRDSL